MRVEADLYDANELKLHGITRAVDTERRRFQHPKREALQRQRDEVYALNAFMRDRERRRFEEYVLATSMSDERANAMRLEDAGTAQAETAEAAEASAAAATEAAEAAAEATAAAEVAAGSLSSHRWLAVSLSTLLSEVRAAIDAHRPLSTAELDAIAKSDAEGKLVEQVDLAVEMALSDAMELALDEALEEVARDVGAEDVLSQGSHGTRHPNASVHSSHAVVDACSVRVCVCVCVCVCVVQVLTANGIGLEVELAPSEVYARAMEEAHKELERATRSYHRSERERLAKEREQARAVALSRRMISLLSPLDQSSPTISTSAAGDDKASTGPTGFYVSTSPYVC